MDSVLLGRERASEREARLPLWSRLQGTYVLGKTGSGKSTLLASLIVQDIRAGRGVTVLDPHGDLVRTIVAHIPPQRRSDVVFLDTTDESVAFGLNLFESDGTERGIARTAEHVIDICKRTWHDSWGPRLEDVLFNSAYALISARQTLAELPRFLTNDTFRHQVLRSVRNRHVNEYWASEYDPQSEAAKRQIRDPVLNKLRPFLTNPAVERIVSQPHSTLNWRQAMDEGKIVLVRLSLDELGPRPVSLLGSTMIAQLLNATLSRGDIPEAERRFFALYADEYQRFATSAFSTLIAEARKYGVAALLAHQWRSQLPPESRDAPLACWNLVAFQLTGDDARELAREFAGSAVQGPITQEPVARLLKAVHPNPAVQTIVRLTLAPLAEYPHGREWRVKWEGIDFYVRGKDVAQGLRVVDRYLVAAMTGQLLIPALHALYFAKIVDAMAPALGVELGSSLYGWDHYSTEQLTGIERALTAAVTIIEAHGWETFSREWEALIRNEPVIDVTADQVDALSYLFGLHPPPYAPSERPWRGKRWSRFFTFIWQLKVLGDLLAAEPLRDPLPGGAATLVTELANQPPYTAHVKLRDGAKVVESVIRTDPLPASGSDWFPPAAGVVAEPPRTDVPAPSFPSRPTPSAWPLIQTEVELDDE